MRDLLSIVGFPLLAMFAGTSLVIQVALNANLRSELASWSWAALVSYLGGTVMMLIILLIQREPRPAASPLASIPFVGRGRERLDVSSELFVAQFADEDPFELASVRRLASCSR